MSIDNRSRAQWREAFEQQVAHARKMRRENDELRAELARLRERMAGLADEAVWLCHADVRVVPVADLRAALAGDA